MRKPIKEQSLAILRERGIPIETILDVGVQNQTQELIKAFPDKKHILFEPVREYFDAIRKNYASVNYELVPAAVGEVPGRSQLELKSIVEGQSVTHAGLVTGNGPGSSFATERRDIDVVSIDSFLAANSHPGPYLLKIDIDGGELAVIAGARASLAQASIVIVETPKAQLVERIDVMMKSGFVLYDLAEPVYYDQSFWQCDAIFIRSDIYRETFRQLTVDFDARLYTPFR